MERAIKSLHMTGPHGRRALRGSSDLVGRMITTEWMREQKREGKFSEGIFPVVKYRSHMSEVDLMWAEASLENRLFYTNFRPVLVVSTILETLKSSLEASVERINAQSARRLIWQSRGLSGGADTTLVLSREPDGVITLYGRGRDIPEIENAVRFDRMTCKWSVLGDATEVRRTDQRKEILAVLEGFGEPMSPKEILGEIGGITRNALDLRLKKMKEAGEIERVDRGKYVLPGKIVDPQKIEQMERLEQ
jgi:hypothetical protein